MSSRVLRYAQFIGAAVIARFALGLGFPLLARGKYREESIAQSFAEILRYFEPIWQVFELPPFLLLGLVCGSLPQQALRRAVGLFAVGLIAFSAIYYFGYMNSEAYMVRRAWTAASLAAGFVPMKCLGVVLVAFLARLVLGHRICQIPPGPLTRRYLPSGALFVLMALTASQSADAREDEIRANGLLFRYLDEGTGPPLVLVHGSIADYREWTKQIGPLSQHYRVIAYSRRYHWPNSPAGKDADAALDRQAEDLEAIIRTLGIAPAHIVGHSYGGATALVVALRHPELIRTLVLAEPAVGGVLGAEGREGALAEEGKAVRAEMKEAFASGNAERIVRTYSSRVAPGEFENASPETRQMLLANISAFELDFQSPRPPFTCNDARQIGAPSLVVTGSLSAAGLQRISEVLAKCLKAGNLVKIPQATHWLQSDHAQLFNDTVLNFVGKH